jgi:hypothetical protein
MIQREQLIKLCVEMTCELEGVDESEIQKGIFEEMDDKTLVREYNWLFTMTHEK